MQDEIAQFACRVGLTPAQRSELSQIVDEVVFQLAAPLVGESVLEGYLARPMPAPQPSPQTPRYTPQQLLGRGGMGEVWRVFDAITARSMAMKILRPELSAALGELFDAEARLTAQLSHPGIVSVHDLGVLPDGRRYFTMEEIAGQTFASLIAAVHDASPDRRWGFTDDGVGLRRLIGVLLRVCEAVGYAHSHSVLHLDLKPGNVMIGEFGEVRVVDWGLARRAHQGAPTSMRGTPAYMAPEQLAGAAPTPATDVYAIGAMLYEILSGGAPFPGTTSVILAQRRAGSTPAPLTAARPIPDDLRHLCHRALSAEPEDRLADAVAMARELSDWLEGARLRDRALAVVAQARALGPQIAALREEAATERAAARALLRRIPPFAPIDAKRAGWQREAAAAARLKEAERLSLRKVQLLQAAFTHQPDLPEAHAALVEHYRERHEEAERIGDLAAATFEHLLRHHDRAGTHAEYLSGEGTLTLHTTPPGATVTLLRGDVVDRRIHYTPHQTVAAPLAALRLPHGRWLLRVEAPGHHPARVPLHLPRAGRWDNRPAPDAAPVPVRLLPLGRLSADHCHVPAGAFSCGGDPDAYSPLPVRRVWVDAFVMQRHPVTNADYIRFLDSLVAAGEEARALRFVPRERAGQRGEFGRILYGRHPDGRFFLKEDADGHLWQPDWPVLCIDWHSAAAYADWLAAQTGLPWRLPTELEWEKAAGRGDHRRFPWGDFLDPTWCCMRRSHRGTPQPAPITAYADDVSPYGVQGLAGNMRDWCADLFHPEGLPVTPDDPGDPALQRTIRGGSWFFFEDSARITSRFGFAQRRGSDNVSFRLVHSL